MITTFTIKFHISNTTSNEKEIYIIELFKNDTKHDAHGEPGEQFLPSIVIQTKQRKHTMQGDTTTLVWYKP